MALRDQPYIPLYVQDLLTDEKLMECSASTHGVYFRLICILHKQEEYGVILLKQKDKQNIKQEINFAIKIAKFLPFDLLTVQSAIEELLLEQVLHLDGDRLIQKRMKKDGLISDERSKAGGKGGKKTQSKNKKFAKAKIEANSEYENDNENTFSFIKIEGYEKIFKRWIDYKNKRKEKYKSEDSLVAAYNKLVKLSGSDIQIADAIIEDAIASNYAGFFELKKSINHNKESQSQESKIGTALNTVTNLLLDENE